MLYASGSDVDTVLVGGRLVKAAGRLLTVDATAALRAAQQRSATIIGRFFDEHPDVAAAWHRKVRHVRGTDRLLSSDLVCAVWTRRFPTCPFRRSRRERMTSCKAEVKRLSFRAKHGGWG